MNTQLNDMVLRASRPSDEAALRRLALMDSTRPLEGEALVAEVDGHVVAALGIAERRVVADPFTRTADAVELLHTRAARLPGAPERSRRGRLLRRPRPLAA